MNELERVRDSLASRISEVKTHLDEYGRAEEASREMIERMADDPAGHKWLRVSNEHIGEPGCRHWHSRPRWGILGMLMGWWRVKVSSGCPLAMGPASGRSRTKIHSRHRTCTLMAKKRTRKRRKERRQGSLPPRLPRTPSAGHRCSAAGGRLDPAERRASAARRTPGDDGAARAPVGIVPAVGAGDRSSALVMLVAGFFVGPAARRHPARDRPGARVAGRARARGPRALLGLPLAHPAARGAVGMAVVAVVLLAVKATA